LNEGFASYSEAVYEEAVNGYDAYLSYVETYFEYWEGGTLYLENAGDTFSVFQPIIYDKGAYTLHMLRGVLGEELFWDGIYAYATDPVLKYGQAETEDLQQVLEDVSGEDLEYFFEQWVYDEYYPSYLYNFENRGDSVAFVIWQVQELAGRRPLFTMPMDVLLQFASGADTTVRIWNDEIYQVFTFATPEPVTMVLPDPEKYILCDKTYSPEIPVSINEAIDEVDIMNIYPNPAYSKTTIWTGSPQDDTYLCIYNGSGTLIISKDVQGGITTTIDLHNLPSGMYYIVLKEQSGKPLTVRKLIVM
jgi:hypothetical protein